MADGQMLRVIVYDYQDSYVCDIDPSQIVELKSTEEINGEHSLTIKTTQELSKTDRLVIRDGMGLWHEYVVTGLVGEHGGRKVGAVVHTYHAVWSLQYDLTATYIDTQVGLVPGHPSVPAPALSGLQAALSGTERWQVGTVTVTSSGSASFYRRSGWEGIKTLTENWGGEVEATIEVGLTGVVGRYVDFLAHEGSTEATRRFDYGGDVSKIKRTVSDEVWPCRIVPLGKATETEAGGYTRRPTIADANQGIVWLEDASAVPFVRIPNGSGGWEYPTSIIKNDVYSDPAQLKAWALEHIGEYTRPQVTYEADVVQLVKAGMNPHGVALGDNVIVVDRSFGDEGLAIDARVIKIVQSLIDSTDVKLTIGNAKQSLSTALGGLSRDVERMTEQQVLASAYQATADYMNALLDRLNAEINATGGYWYMIPGIGTRTYDVEVSDPAVGAEASKVVEVRGGNIRIADSRTAAGEWDWKTVFQAGRVLADLVTAAHLTSGYIGSADSGNFWDLDSGEFRMASTAQLGTQTVQQVVDGVASASSAASSAQSTANSASSAAAAAQSTADSASSAAASAQSAINALSTQDAIFNLLTNNGALQGLYMSGGELYINATYLMTGMVKSNDGKSFWDLVNNKFQMLSRDSSLKVGLGTTTAGDTTTMLAGVEIQNNQASYTTRYGDSISIEPYQPSVTNSAPMLILRRVQQGGTNSLSLVAESFSNNYIESTGSLNIDTSAGKSITLRSGTSSSKAKAFWTGSQFDMTGAVKVYGNLSASTKNRFVQTKDYGELLLYSYETPAPMFGDVGSGTIGEDGLCYVEIDDRFTETARSDYAYQVFLQKCGEGDLWVAEKTPTHFVVKGTAGLPFDWEIKARQVDLSDLRFEDSILREQMEPELELGAVIGPAIDGYEQTTYQADQIESIYDDELRSIYETEESDEAA